MTPAAERCEASQDVAGDHCLWVVRCNVTLRGDPSSSSQALGLIPNGDMIEAVRVSGNLRWAVVDKVEAERRLGQGSPAQWHVKIYG